MNLGWLRFAGRLTSAWILEELVEKVMAGIGNGGAGSGTAGLIAKGAMKMMTMAKVKVAVVVGALSIGIWAGAAGPTTQPASRPVAVGSALSVMRPAKAVSFDPAVEFLLAQNEQSRAKIRSYVMTFSQEYRDDEPSDKTASKTLATLRQKGPLIRMERHSEASFFSRNEQQTRDIHSVLNERYFATWHVKTDNAQQMDHESMSQMSQRSRDFQASELAPIPLNYAFGGRDEPLRSLLEWHPEQWRWVANEAKQGNRTVWELRRMPKQGPPQPTITVYVLDPERGFLVTEARQYRPSGKLISETRVEVAMADGVWYPSKIDQKEVFPVDGRSFDGDQSYETEEHIQVKEARFNEEMVDEEFTVAAMELSDGTRLFRERVDGTKSVYKVIDSKFVDNEIANEMEALELLSQGPSNPDGGLPAATRPTTRGK